LNQTNQDFEVIIVDDGSTDETKQMLLSLTDTRIQCIFLRENYGAPRARNVGIEMAKGKYIAFLDSDDSFLPDHLSNALKILDLRESVCSYSQVIIDRGNGINYLKPSRACKEDEEVSEYYLCSQGWVQTSTLVLPASLAKAVKYNEAFRSNNDADFTIRLVNAGGKLIMQDNPGAIYYDRHDYSRLSRLDDIEKRLIWLGRIRPIITERAYWGDMGWKIAKLYAQRGLYFKAFINYINALRRGCYKPKMAVIVFVQIIMPVKMYRRFADFMAQIGVKP
jgi:glycosyltransferase involved in cell wall biosynthesis